MAEQAVQVGNGTRYRHLGAAKKDDVGKPALLLQAGAEQARWEGVTQLDEISSHLRREGGRQSQQGRRGPQYRCRNADHPVGMRRVESRSVWVRRRHDRDQRGVEHLDDPQ